ncbi:hypothetical protein PHMEG_00035273, partial [Phytophthora megakarya]
YTSPYFTITQSSEFGKSRALQQLAHWSSTHCEYLEDCMIDMTVLYICMDNVEGGMEYPRPTVRLRDWLFSKEGCTVDSIADGLLKVFTYATKHYDTKMRWKMLVFDICDDGTIVNELKRVKVDKKINDPELIEPRTWNNSSESVTHQMTTQKLLCLS